MAAAAKTSEDRILRAAAEMLEAEGPRAVTMLGVARKVGIKGASLYKHYYHADALLRALEEKNMEDLGRTLSSCGQTVPEMANAFLQFCQDRPEQSKLLFRSGDPKKSLVAMRAPITTLSHLLGDEAEALVRLRVLTCFLHGFNHMEMSGAFRQGGDTSMVVKMALQLIVPEHGGN